MTSLHAAAFLPERKRFHAQDLIRAVATRCVGQKHVTRADMSTVSSFPSVSVQGSTPKVAQLPSTGLAWVDCLIPKMRYTLGTERIFAR